MHIIICGGGVIGAATAYALSCRGIDVTIVERWKVGGAASGKSGGFLARDWCDGTPVEPLAHRSFDLHQQWADELANPYGFRLINTFSTAMSQRRNIAASDTRTVASWLSDRAGHRRQLGDTTTTAQLEPLAFTTSLVEAACAKGAKLEIAAVASLERSLDGNEVSAVALDDGRSLAADAAVLAMGPWSIVAAAWVDLPPVYGLKGHSIIFRPTEPLPAEAAFAEFEDASGDVLSPEIVSRSDGTVYVCGLSATEALPLDPMHVLPEPDGSDRLRSVATALVPKLADAQVITEQACFRPVTADGLPLIGLVAGMANAYIATGHSVWGMLNAPGTGEAIAELITTGTSQAVDLSPFSPGRLRAFNPSQISIEPRTAGM